jgi:hypothetical protein
MHLDGQHFFDVKELEEQWKSLKTVCEPSHHLSGEALQEMTYGLSFEDPIGHATGVIFAIAQRPCLPERAFAWQRIAK